MQETRFQDRQVKWSRMVKEDLGPRILAHGTYVIAVVASRTLTRAGNRLLSRRVICGMGQRVFLN